MYDAVLQIVYTWWRIAEKLTLCFTLTFVENLICDAEKKKSLVVSGGIDPVVYRKKNGRHQQQSPPSFFSSFIFSLRQQYCMECVALYHNAPCDVVLCSLALLTFKREHQCGKTMFNGMLALIKNLLPARNAFPGTLSQVFSALNLAGQDDLTKISHHFCVNECSDYLM